MVEIIEHRRWFWSTCSGCGSRAMVCEMAPPTDTAPAVLSCAVCLEPDKRPTAREYSHAFDRQLSDVAWIVGLLAVTCVAAAIIVWIAP